MKNIIIAVVVIIIIILLIFVYKSPEDSAKVVVEGEEFEEMEIESISGVLKDVTGGKVVRGIVTLPTTSGTAQANIGKGSYLLIAEFVDLPSPQGTDFYEGWVARRGSNMSVKSAGKLRLADGKYTNTFLSDKNLIDHDFYILTIEPDDGDPAPADHILEGVMK